MDTLRFAIIEAVSLKWKVNGEINGFTSTWYVKTLKTSIGSPFPVKTSRFNPDFYVNISSCFLDRGYLSRDFWMFLQLEFTLIYFFLTLPLDFCSFCDLASSVETDQLICNASLVQWFLFRLHGSGE